MYSVRILLAFALASAPALVCSAAESDPVDEIIVTAPTGEFLQPTQLLEGRELTLRKAATLGETLENEPGISSSAYGKGASRPIIRGQAGPRVQVLKDNVSTLDVSALSPDHNPTVEPLLVERIEVVRGPATLAYGSAAAGGVVNVLEGRIPTDPESEPFSGAFEARADSVANSKAIVGRLDGRAGQFGWHFDASTGDSDDYDIAGFATADPADRPADEAKGVQPNSFTDFDAVAGGASWLSTAGYAGVSVSRYETQYGLVGPEAGSAGGPFIDMQQTRVDVRGEHDLAGFIDTVRFAVGINDYEHSENESDGEVATLFQNDEWEARLEIDHATIAGFSGAVGLQLNDRDLEASGEEAFVPNSEAARWGLFAIEGFDTSLGRVQFGLCSHWFASVSQ
jgi:iron complex outermembrane receptor protein